MQQIDVLQLEIKSFEIEIQKLNQELTEVGGFTLRLASSNAPSEIAKSIRTEAQQVLERQPVIKGLRDAIAELTSRLEQKQSELEKLEKEQQKQSRKKRIEQGKSLLCSKSADVEQAAESLKNLFLELKSLAREYEGDFNQINPPTSSRQILNTASLLNFGMLTTPTLTQNDGRFLLSSQAFDVFESKKEALRRERVEVSRISKEYNDQMMLELRRRENDEKMRVDREYKTSLLISKRQELKDFLAARADRLLSLKTANVDDFNNAIASLEVEIESLQKPMQP
jgi:hypothetical protein